MRRGARPALLVFRLLTSGAAMWFQRGLVPWVAMMGSQAFPVVMTACRWRRIVAAAGALAEPDRRVRAHRKAAPSRRPTPPTM